ncbi:MAG: TIGR02679 domain-containing protein, partial [Actinomycetota bacterium]|nr:TIGR02679 domain-containing protein [Actinomycetota bacterium]
MTAEDGRRSAALARLAEPPYAPLWAAARKRLEGNGRAVGGSPLVLRGLDAAERNVVCGLLGISPAGDGPVRVRLADLDDALRRGAASVGLIELLESMAGPVRDRRDERAVATLDKAMAWAAVESHPVLTGRPELAPWVADIRCRGTATRLAGSAPAGAALTGAALDVLGRLPAANQALSVLAAETAGGAHGLDRGQPLGTLVAAALAVLDVEEGENDSRVEWAGAPAYWWRRRWARVGVVCDDLSVSALVLNLPVEPGGDIIAEAAYEHAMANEPLRLTLRQLAIGDWSFRRGAVVYVCENPSVL